MVLSFEFYETGLPGDFVLGGAAYWVSILFPQLFLPGYYRYIRERLPQGKRLLSLPAGDAFALLESRLGPELRTVWLGKGASCHETDDQHPFSLQDCPHARDKDCWQCLYMLQVMLTIEEGETAVAATTNLFETEWDATILNSGSSEVAGEQFSEPLPHGWGTGWFPRRFGKVSGCRRVAPIHPETGQPLGVGCRWERSYLDSLEELVYVVAVPPGFEELQSSDLLWINLIAPWLSLLQALVVQAVQALRIQGDEQALRIQGDDWEFSGIGKAAFVVEAFWAVLTWHSRGWKTSLVYFGPHMALACCAVALDLKLNSSSAWYEVVVLIFPPIPLFLILLVVRKTRLGWRSAFHGQGLAILAILSLVTMLVDWAFISCPVVVAAMISFVPLTTFTQLGDGMLRLGFGGFVQEVGHAFCGYPPPKPMTPLRLDYRYRARGQGSASTWSSSSCSSSADEL